MAITLTYDQAAAIKRALIANLDHSFESCNQGSIFRCFACEGLRAFCVASDIPMPPSGVEYFHPVREATEQDKQRAQELFVGKN